MLIEGEIYVFFYDGYIENPEVEEEEEEETNGNLLLMYVGRGFYYYVRMGVFVLGHMFLVVQNIHDIYLAN